MPTVDRGLCPMVFWPIEIAGDNEKEILESSQRPIVVLNKTNIMTYINKE